MRESISNFLKLAAAAVILAIGIVAISSPAQAGKYSSYQAAMQHYADCARWLVSDPAKHAEFCNPGHVVVVHGSTGSRGEKTIPCPPPPPCHPPCPPPCHPCPPPPCHPCPPPPCHPCPPPPCGGGIVGTSFLSHFFN